MFEYLLGRFIILFMVAMTVFSIYVIIEDIISPTISIRKDHWSCTESRKETTLMNINGTLMPVVNTICIKYERNK